MPDWTREIRAAIARLEMDPAREASLVEELSQHLTDRYDELRGNGVDDAEASAAAPGRAQRRHTGCGVEAAALAIAGGRWFQGSTSASGCLPELETTCARH